MASDSVTTEHTNEPISCHRTDLQEIAQAADHEYYMSAGGPKLGHRERAKRGQERIEKYIGDLEKLRETVACPACQQEIERQIELQRKGLREIEHVWSTSQTTE